MFSARFKIELKHCQPGFIHNATLAVLNGTCILFPEMRPVFEQRSLEPRSYTGLHLLPPSELCSRSDSPYKPNFGSAIDDVPMSNWNLDMAPGWAMFSARFKIELKHCQPGVIHNGTLAVLNGTCILFPEMRPVFEQRSLEPRSCTGLHLLAPSKPCSPSGSP